MRRPDVEVSDVRRGERRAIERHGAEEVVGAGDVARLPRSRPDVARATLHAVGEDRIADALRAWTREGQAIVHGRFHPDPEVAFASVQPGERHVDGSRERLREAVHDAPGCAAGGDGQDRALEALAGLAAAAGRCFGIAGNARARVTVGEVGAETILGCAAILGGADDVALAARRRIETPIAVGEARRAVRRVVAVRHVVRDAGPAGVGIEPGQELEIHHFRHLRRKRARRGALAARGAPVLTAADGGAVAGLPGIDHAVPAQRRRRGRGRVRRTAGRCGAGLGIALRRVHRGVRRGDRVGALGLEGRHAAHTVHEVLQGIDRPAARRAARDRHGRTRRRESDRRRREVAGAAADAVRPAARLTDLGHGLGARARDERARLRVGTRAARALETRVVALLPRLVLGAVGFDRAPPDLALAPRHRRIGARGEMVVVEPDRLVDGRIADACKAGRDVAAVGDRVGARTVLEVRTRADVPADRRERLVGARAAHVIGTAALLVDRAPELRLRLRDDARRLRIRARTGGLPAQHGIAAAARGFDLHLRELGETFRDLAFARDRARRRPRGGAEDDGTNEHSDQRAGRRSHGGLLLAPVGSAPRCVERMLRSARRAVKAPQPYGSRRKTDNPVLGWAGARKWVTA